MDNSDAQAPLPGSPELEGQFPVFELDGRQFRPIAQSLTAAQDAFLLAYLRRAGAVEALADRTLTEDERANEILTRVLLSGETFHVLAGCLTEQGKTWSRAEAQRNAAAFAGITDPEQKTLMLRGALVGFVLGFFARGARSSETSPRSSGPSDAGAPTESADRRTSEISRPSSAKLHEATATGSTR